MNKYDFTKVSDDELFELIREQVNLSRNTLQGHDRAKTRAIAEEARKRGWNFRRKQENE